MRMRIISAAVVLGLSLVGIALAQQAGGKPKDQASDRATLRAQVVKLRAEVEILELEHEADRAALSSLLKDERDSESQSWKVARENEALSHLMKMAMGVGKPEEFMKTFGDEKTLEAEAEKMAGRIRADAERMRRAFVKRSTDLAEARLDLAEVEKRYNDAR